MCYVYLIDVVDEIGNVTEEANTGLRGGGQGQESVSEFGQADV